MKTRTESYWDAVEEAGDKGLWVSNQMRECNEACRQRIIDIEEEKIRLLECVKDFRIRTGKRR